jgi:hypothetical protein
MLRGCRFTTSRSIRHSDRIRHAFPVSSSPGSTDLGPRPELVKILLRAVTTRAHKSRGCQQRPYTSASAAQSDQALNSAVITMHEQTLAEVW